MSPNERDAAAAAAPPNIKRQHRAAKRARPAGRVPRVRRLVLPPVPQSPERPLARRHPTSRVLEFEN